MATAVLAVLFPLEYGGLAGVLLLAAGLTGAAVTAAAVWWALTRRGPTRQRRCSRSSRPPESLSCSRSPWGGHSSCPWCCGPWPCGAAGTRCAAPAPDRSVRRSIGRGPCSAPSSLLGVLGVKVDSAAEAAALLLAPAPAGLVVLSAREVVVDADHPEIEVGVDGETLLLPTPVHCRIAPPPGLRVRGPAETAGRCSGPTPAELEAVAQARGDGRAVGVGTGGRRPCRSRLR